MCGAEATAVWFCGSILFLCRGNMNKKHHAVREQVLVKSQETRHFEDVALQGAKNGHNFRLWLLARATPFACGSYKSHPKKASGDPWRLWRRRESRFKQHSMLRCLPKCTEDADGCKTEPIRHRMFLWVRRRPKKACSSGIVRCLQASKKRVILENNCTRGAVWSW